MRISHSRGRSSAGGKIGADHFAALPTANCQSRSSWCGCSSGDSPGRITWAWRVVSLIQLSTLIMQSRPPNAASSRSPPGVDSTGFPATVNRARICPGPGVAISSARHDTGTCPSTSGAPRTRLVHRPKLGTPPSRSGIGRVATAQADGRANISPPGTSK
jgi:hypothetical protein